MGLDGWDVCGIRDFFWWVDWFDVVCVCGYLWVIVLFNFVVFVWLIGIVYVGVDCNGFLLGIDFLSFWIIGYMFYSGGNFYDVVVYIVV